MKAHTFALLTLLLAVVIAPLVLPPFYLALVNYIGLYSLVAIGLVLLTGIGGLTSFGQAAFVGVGAYTAAFVSSSQGLSPWLGLVVGIGLTVVLALVLGLITLRLAGHYLPLGTLAWGVALYYLFGNLPWLGGFAGIADLPPIQLLGWSIDSDRDFTVVIGALVLLALWLMENLLRSRQGRAIRSLKEAKAMAQAMGINTLSTQLWIFVLAAVLAAVSGWLYAHMQRMVNPTPFSLSMGIEYLFMIVLGGAGSLWGALLGAALLTLVKQLLENTLPLFFGSSGSLELILFGVMIVLMLQFAEQGVLAEIRKRLPQKKLPSPPAPGALPSPPQKRPSAVQRGQTLLRAEGLIKRFGGLIANDNMTLAVNSGEIVALIGPNGAGKSTLFNLLSGALRPSAGQITFKGKLITRARPRDVAQLGISRTFQHVRLVPDMSVLENAALGAHMRGHAGFLRSLLHLERGEERHLLAEAACQLQRVGLGAYAHMPASSLALGQQRILEIARALCSAPQLLLLDEPAAGLRYNEKQALAELLVQLREEGLGVLLVEHDMDFVMGLADDVVVMEFGRRLAGGTPTAIQADPAVLAAYLGGMDEPA